MWLMLLVFIIILLIVHGIGNLLPADKNENVKEIYSKSEIEKESFTDYKESRVVTLRFMNIHGEVSENTIKELSEILGFNKEKIVEIIKKSEEITDEEIDNLSDEEWEKLTPVIKRGLTLEEAKKLRDDLMEKGVICALDVE